MERKGNKKPNKVRHYWMSTEKKSIKKCTSCGCVRRSVRVSDGVTKVEFELNGNIYENVAPDCKYIS